jgi:ABC-2 type transport system permease protein
MYSGMMVMETVLGADQVREFYDYEMGQYLTGRTIFTNREVPLLEVENHAYLHYHKGAVALYTLREHIGAEQVNLALRRYLAKFGGGGVPPFPTSLDLYAEFQAVTPDSLHQLLHDLFAEITLWDVRADSASVVPMAGGRFRVTVDVTARKLRADSIGNETEVPMNDLVEVGVFPEGDGAPLYLQRHRIVAGRQTITVVVPRLPATAGIDPLGKLIQREKSDNVVEVQASTAAVQ